MSSTPGATDGAVGVTALLHRGRIVLIADTLVHEWPDEKDLADIAIKRGAAWRAVWGWSRAWPSCPSRPSAIRCRSVRPRCISAAQVLDASKVDFEYEGEMTVDVALNPEQMAQYPFCRLTGPANILVVPARHSASISVKLMQEMAGATVIGPILTGVTKPIQICSTKSTVNDILNMAVMAACRLGQTG